MNIFGIGTMELAVILLVAIIALGPGKTMETARTLGRIMREARRAFTEVMDAAALGDSDGDGDGGGRRQRPGDRQQQRPGDGNQDGGAAGVSDDSPPVGSRPVDGPVRPPDTPLEGPAHLAGQRDDGVESATGSVVDAETQRRREATRE